MENSVLFASYGFATRLIHAGDVESMPFSKKLMAGGFSGFCVAAVLTPVELIKCKMQTTNEAVRERVWWLLFGAWCFFFGQGAVLTHAVRKTRTRVETPREERAGKMPNPSPKTSLCNHKPSTPDPQPFLTGFFLKFRRCGIRVLPSACWPPSGRGVLARSTMVTWARSAARCRGIWLGLEAMSLVCICRYQRGGRGAMSTPLG